MRKSTLQDCSHYSLVGKFICYICFQSFVCILMPMPNFVIMHIQVMFNYYTQNKRTSPDFSIIIPLKWKAQSNSLSCIMYMTLHGSWQK